MSLWTTLRHVLSRIVLAALVFAGASVFPSPALAGPGTARALSVLLPGAGHMYAGDSGKGLLLSSVYIGTVSLAVAVGPWTWEDERQGDPFFSDLAEGTGTSTTTKVIFFGAAATAVATWIYAVWDAPKTFGRYSLVPEWRDGQATLAARAVF